ncbi:methyl-accepting chemotaxis protein [Aneurinibacillus terranovensis]|uniref:methyl-accepting chemotaxis protein n=1 Tax=Aneurinibacillus terranovensis TaxID=278991 RepID=UPI000419142A|nr:methyl-accepting chemotaxis protein [Aneurinibacillus terranovensis]
MSLFGVNIRSKLILAFALTLLIPSLVIGLISFDTAKNKVGEQMLSTVKGSVQLLNDLITNTIDPENKDVEYLSNIATVTPQGENPALRQQLDRFSSIHPEILHTYVGTQTGKMILSPIDKLPKGYDPRIRPWYQDAMKQKGTTVITDPYVDAITQDVVVTIARATKDGTGVTAIDLNLQKLSEAVKKVQIGKEGYAFILDKKSNVIVHPTLKPGSAAKGPQVDQMFGKDSGEYSYTYNGQPKQMVFTTNQTTGWKLAGTLNSDEIKQEAKPIFNMTVLVIIIAALLGSLMVYFVISSITRPLKRLVDAAEKVSEGDLTERIEVNTHDELGHLSHSFNKMSDSLHSILYEVNNKSRQLTASSEELTASAEQTSRATEQIASTIEQVAAGSEQQTHSMEKTSGILNQMSAAIEQIAASAQHVSTSSLQSADVAEKGSLSIHTAVQQMDSINETVNNLASMVKGLGERSQEIGQIVEVITGIATQTNLLALNAAIEAARAGEHGRGFAVVADEVRKLAEQSAHSAGQIAELIAHIQQETEEAVESMEAGKNEVKEGIQVVHSAGESFTQIQQSIKDVASQIQEVSAAVQQMSASSDEAVHSFRYHSSIAEATVSGTQSVSAATEEQLAYMQELSSSAASLAKMADELHLLVTGFKIE